MISVRNFINPLLRLWVTEVDIKYNFFASISGSLRLKLVLASVYSAVGKGAATQSYGMWNLVQQVAPGVGV